MNTFLVDEKIFKVEDIKKNKFTVNSNPLPYNVELGSYKNFEYDGFNIVDESVSKLYKIKSDKTFIVDSNEYNKNPDYAFKIVDFLLNKNFSKSDILNVFGGGVVQDLSAFVPKIYKRGINWRFFPTTLLSQCDSCIGGKTALNYKNYKNQIALFSAPTEVIIDFNFLETLPSYEIDSGLGEIIKLFIIGGNQYLNKYNSFSLEEKILNSLLIKKSVIEEDEFEFNYRKVLNYGHSFGHVLESLSEFQIPHGSAVLLGIHIINNLFDKNEAIEQIVAKHVDINLIKSFKTEDVISCLTSDKKVLNNKITLINCPQPGVSNFVPTEINNELKVKLNEIFAN